jgi:hypothetical protein
MSITTTAVTSITLTYANASAWQVFNAANLATGGNLQQNWLDLTSALSGQYKSLLNSCAEEINILNVSAPYAGSAAYAVSATYSVSASTAANASYAVSAGILSGYSSIMTTTGSQVMTNKIKAQNHSSYTTGYLRNVIMSTTSATGGASGDIWFEYTA